MTKPVKNVWTERDGWGVKYEVRSSGDATLVASYADFSRAMDCVYKVLIDGPVDVIEVRYRRIASLVERSGDE